MKVRVRVNISKNVERKISEKGVDENYTFLKKLVVSAMKSTDTNIQGIVKEYLAAV